MSNSMTHQIIAAEAAELERLGDYKAAAIAWRTAEVYAPNKAEAHWCYARARFCTTWSR
ncbi:MAG: ANR family transcriptional regulator [Shewanella sp.]